MQMQHEIKRAFTFMVYNSGNGDEGQPLPTTTPACRKHGKRRTFNHELGCICFNPNLNSQLPERKRGRVSHFAEARKPATNGAVGVFRPITGNAASLRGERAAVGGWSNLQLLVAPCIKGEFNNAVFLDCRARDD
jgi:hypothetical protein